MDLDLRDLQKQIDTKEEREIVLRVGDVHYPYHDKRAVNLAFKFAQFLQPKVIILDEWIDFYALSKYNKDPSRKNDLQKDIDGTCVLLTWLRNMCPNTIMIMVESNHDKRLRTYLRTRAEELDNLRCLQFPELLRLNELNIEYRKSFIYKSFLWKHGSIIRKHSGMTAKGELEKEGMSGCSGHSHRLSLFFKTLRGGKFVWVESGCLCDTEDVEYIDGTADWLQGMSLVSFKKDSEHYYPAVVPIIDYEILWGKRTFTA